MSKSLLHNLGRFSALLIALSLSLTHLCDSRIDSHLILADIRSEVSFRFDMHNCFKAVVKQK